MYKFSYSYSCKEKIMAYYTSNAEHPINILNNPINILNINCLPEFIY